MPRLPRVPRMVVLRLQNSSLGELRAGLDRPLPESLVVGNGTAVGLSGWCFHPRLTIRSLELLFDGERVPVVLSGIQRRELRERFADGRAEWSGFAAILPIARVQQSTTQPIRIRASLAGG